MRQVYPDRLAYVDQVLFSASAAIAAAKTLDGQDTGLVLSLVVTPLKQLSEALLVLSLEQWSQLVMHLSHDKRKEVASNLAGLVIQQEGTVSRMADAAKLLQLVGPLLTDDPESKVDEDDARPEPIDAETASELGPVSRLIHRLKATDSDDQCRILNAAHRQGAAGSFRRSPFAFVPIIFSCLSLTRRCSCFRLCCLPHPGRAPRLLSKLWPCRIYCRVQANEEIEVGTHKLLSFVANMVEHLSRLAPVLALRLYLQCAQTALSVGEEADAYEFITQAPAQITI